MLSQSSLYTRTKKSKQSLKNWTKSKNVAGSKTRYAHYHSRAQLHASLFRCRRLNYRSEKAKIFHLELSCLSRCPLWLNWPLPVWCPVMEEAPPVGDPTKHRM